MTTTDGDALRVAVIGAGMAGILSAIKLTEAGITDFTVYEKGDQVGGTWRENTYPGIACDVPSHLYSYSFALNPEWSHPYSPGAEIESYFDRVTREHGVLDTIRFGDEVIRCAWADGRWHLETAAGHRDSVHVVIAATGVLHHPNIPAFTGEETFAGAMFHSARWDHSVSLDGARIGVIGTGSTAVQITCALVERAAHYSLFQRTAQWVLPQENEPYSAAQLATFHEFPDQLRELHDNLSTLFAEGFSNAVVDANSPVIQMIAQACRDNLESNVADLELRERLRPDYAAACKRLIVAPNFYDAIQHPNSELVTSGIDRIEPGGIRTHDGVLHELDVIVLATGFHADAFMRPMHITGRDGLTLNDAWNPRPEAYLSITIPEFPNFFMLNGPNGPVGNFSLIEVAELQFAYIMQLVDLLRRDGPSEICATADAMRTFEAERTEAASHTIWTTGCKSWYLDDRGIPATWPWPFSKFRAAMREPDISAYDLR